MWMIHRGTVPLVAALAALATGALQPPGAAAQGPPEMDITGTLWVEGGSTVRSWDCQAGEVQAEVTPGPAARLALSELADVVSGLDVRVPVQQLDCENDTMNDHMWKALGVDDHPQIEFRMDGYDVLQESTGSQVEVNGTLTIHGAVQPISMIVEVESREEGLRLRGVHGLNMRDYDVDPPRLMFGALRVHEDVEVHFDLLMKRRGSGR